MHLENAKRAAGNRAASCIENGMIVGLGTGSTAYYFIEALIQKCKQGLKIKTCASSSQSFELAKEGKIPIFDMNELSHIDITVDGADEIDSQKRMIKGGGGAHVREKILAMASKEMIVIVDETKLVPQIGRSKLPIEILPFGSTFTQKKIENLGFKGKWRCPDSSSLNQELFVSDNGNFIFDIHFATPPTHPEKVHEELIRIPGVVDTGFFFHIATQVIIGKLDGTTIVQS